jgi:hypothetical protein
LAAGAFLAGALPVAGSAAEVPTSGASAVAGDPVAGVPVAGVSAAGALVAGVAAAGFAVVTPSADSSASGSSRTLPDVAAAGGFGADGALAAGGCGADGALAAGGCGADGALAAGGCGAAGAFTAGSVMAAAAGSGTSRDVAFGVPLAVVFGSGSAAAGVSAGFAAAVPVEADSAGAADPADSGSRGRGTWSSSLGRFFSRSVTSRSWPMPANTARSAWAGASLTRSLTCGMRISNLSLWGDGHVQNATRGRLIVALRRCVFPAGYLDALSATSQGCRQGTETLRQTPCQPGGAGPPASHWAVVGPVTCGTGHNR